MLDYRNQHITNLLATKCTPESAFEMGMGQRRGVPRPSDRSARGAEEACFGAIPLRPSPKLAGASLDSGLVPRAMKASPKHMIAVAGNRTD